MEGEILPNEKSSILEKTEGVDNVSMLSPCLKQNASNNEGGFIIVGKKINKNNDFVGQTPRVT
ncbi:hypothetical protein MA16_Dca024225 [Dendrobium catenatum]|uniref:Uncharacterized protein n=1 Tax=Dendrobium catenatum TaxID=906689 RepID=A0A2I0XG34_9ASPA|nr:hypothetical protein MA16_Dca024225 [Dendrobium catenatum]